MLAFNLIIFAFASSEEVFGRVVFEIDAREGEGGRWTYADWGTVPAEEGPK